MRRGNSNSKRRLKFGIKSNNSESRMLRESGYQPDYGVMGGGAVNRSIIGRLPSKTRVLGPVAAVSYRVASRIANLLKAGEAVRSADDLDAVRVILFHAPPDQEAALLAILKAAKIHWYGKSLILCDCGPARVCRILSRRRSECGCGAALRACRTRRGGRQWPRAPYRPPDGPRNAFEVY